MQSELKPALDSRKGAERRLKGIPPSDIVTFQFTRRALPAGGNKRLERHDAAYPRVNRANLAGRSAFEDFVPVARATYEIRASLRIERSCHRTPRHCDRFTQRTPDSRSINGEDRRLEERNPRTVTSLFSEDALVWRHPHGAQLRGGRTRTAIRV